MGEPESLPKIVGANARRLRADAGATLEQMASALDDYGLSWSTGRVGDLEAGRVAATIPTVVAVVLGLSQLHGRDIPIAELFRHDGAARINDRLTMYRGALHKMFAGEPMTGHPFSAEGINLEAVMEGARTEFDRMHKFAERYGDVGLDMLVRAERGIGLAEKRAAEDLGVKAGTVAHAAVYMWRRTFTEERDHRAGPDASPQKLGQVTRRMKTELSSALKELGCGDD